MPIVLCFLCPCGSCVCSAEHSQFSHFHRGINVKIYLVSQKKKQKQMDVTMTSRQCGPWHINRQNQWCNNEHTHSDTDSYLASMWIFQFLRMHPAAVLWQWFDSDVSVEASCHRGTWPAEGHCNLRITNRRVGTAAPWIVCTHTGINQQSLCCS